MTAINSFDGHAIGIEAPPTHHAAITASDTTDMVNVTRSIYVGTGGDLKVTNVSGETVPYKNVPQGFELIGFFTRVWATGTTAADLIGRW